MPGSCFLLQGVGTGRVEEKALTLTSGSSVHPRAYTYLPVCSIPPKVDIFLLNFYCNHNGTESKEFQQPVV